MSALNWGLIPDGGAFESLMHLILFAEDPNTILFGRPGKDSGQDARSPDGSRVYQAKFRQNLDMNGAVQLAFEELEKIRKYRRKGHANHRHWKKASRWTLVANFAINPNDDATWQDKVATAFKAEGLDADYWDLETLEGRLTTLPEIREAFFEHENRTLVGLREAYLSLGGEKQFFDLPIVGREAELNGILEFASAEEKTVLPVIGARGIGKSRLLFESLVLLSEKGWRVLWGLTHSMSRSSSWFHSLNTSQKTIVALEDPSRELLHAVLEQMAAYGRRNWCVVVSLGLENTNIISRFGSHPHIAEPIRLKPLSETNSKELLQACLTKQADPAWLYSAYQHAQGSPGWLCLIARLVNKNSLSLFPAESDGLAKTYVESCLASLGPNNYDAGLKLLRWLALWGKLRVAASEEERSALRFLEAQGIASDYAVVLLQKLAGTGLVRNWGVEKRSFAVEPLIIRQHILGDWLMAGDGDANRVNLHGQELVAKLIEGTIPSQDVVLETLSHLALSRLSEANVEAFLHPVFQEMARFASQGNSVSQHRVLDLLEKCGKSDPESALEVLNSTRKHVGETAELSHPFWGERTVTHSSVLARIPWILYDTGTQVSSPALAHRFLEEYRVYLATEHAEEVRFPSDKHPTDLLKRAICGSTNSNHFARAASEIVFAEIDRPSERHFIGQLLSGLLDPMREWTEWTGAWQLAFNSRAIFPGSVMWRLAGRVRAKSFDLLCVHPDQPTRIQLWDVLSRSHRSIHYIVSHGVSYHYVSQEHIKDFRRILKEDLHKAHEILRRLPVELTIEEASSARKLWSWYLDYGKDEDPLELAKECEGLVKPASAWDCQAFFKFDHEENLTPETNRVATAFQSATSSDIIASFFTEADRYLRAVRGEQFDLADWSRIRHLAEACLAQFDLTKAPQSQLTQYVLSVLGAPKLPTTSWHFAVTTARMSLRRAKGRDLRAFPAYLAELLALAHSQRSFLLDLFSNVHPRVIGNLTIAELESIVSQRSDFAEIEFLFLLGGFLPVAKERVMGMLDSTMEALREQPRAASDCISAFVNGAYYASLRYDWPPAEFPLARIVSLLTEMRLDGALFEDSHFIEMRDKTKFRLSMSQFAKLIESRVHLENGEERDPSIRAVPFSHSLGEWCHFERDDPAELQAFHNLCSLVLESGYLVQHVLPGYIAKIDPNGLSVAAFVDQYLADNPDLPQLELGRLCYLASEYFDDSDAWKAISAPLCALASSLNRESRRGIYSRLSRKNPEFNSSSSDTVALFRLKRDNALAKLAEEAPDSVFLEYRQWAVRIAEGDLQQRIEEAEEDGW